MNELSLSWYGAIRKNNLVRAFTFVPAVWQIVWYVPQTEIFDYQSVFLLFSGLEIKIFKVSGFFPRHQI